MTGFNISTLVLAVVIAVILLLSGQGAHAEVCDGDITKLESACEEFVSKHGPPKDPSPECCHVIQHADIPCACANFPMGSEDTISMVRVAYVANFCGQPLKSGTKSGDYTVPGA